MTAADRRAVAARNIAAQCFAFARSQTRHPAEREAAISRGVAICEKYGLDLDSFDIPGRDASSGAGSQRDSDRQRFEDAFEAAMADAALRAGARPGETIYEARRRNFEEACAAAAERDRLRALKAQHQRARQAANDLWTRDVMAYDNDGKWFVVHAGHAAELDDAALIHLAEQIREGAPA